VEWVFGGTAAVLLVLLSVWYATWGILWQGRIYWHQDGDVLKIRRGCIFFPHWIEVKNESLRLTLQRGSDANISPWMHGYAVLTLNVPDRDEAVQLAYSMTSDATVACYHELETFVRGECVNNLVFRVLLPNGNWIKLSRTATWSGGRNVYFQSTVRFPSPRVATIEQIATKLSRQGFSLTGASNVYVNGINRGDDEIRLAYSDGHVEKIARSNCLALQICKEDGMMRYSRFEINLVLSEPEGKRITLVSYDMPPPDEPLDIYETAEQMGTMLDLKVMDHL
jgi:hypothetical protein